MKKLKKILITIIFSLTTGSILGYMAYNRMLQKEEEAITTVISMQNQVYAIQAGVFDKLENANKLAEKYGGLVIYDENKYRVYIAIISKTLPELKKYYDEKNIAYYVKNISVPETFNEKLQEYEKLLLATTKENYEDIIKQILKEYESITNEESNKET